MPGKMLVINPGPRSKKKGKKRRGKMPAGLARYMAKKYGRKRRARINPRLGQLFSRQNLKTHVVEPVIAAGIGGAASVVLEVGLANLPQPEWMKTSALAQNGLRLAAAILLGVGAARVMGKERGRLVTVGALTVAAAGAIRDALKRVLPADLQAKVKGLGGIADYVDYETEMGALEYQQRLARSTTLGVIETDTSLAGGAFADPFMNSFE